MDKTTLTTLTAAGVSIICALTTLLASIINSRRSVASAEKLARQNATSAEELEILRFELERRTAELERRQKEIDENKEDNNKYIDILCEAIGSLQRVKDVVQKAIRAPSGSHYSETAINHIEVASDNMLKCFEDNRGKLQKYESKIFDLEQGSITAESSFHRAKNMAVEIEGRLKHDLLNTEYTSELTIEKKQYLEELITTINEIQVELQTSLNTGLVKSASASQTSSHSDPES